jgi:hypothetical protein
VSAEAEQKGAGTRASGLALSSACDRVGEKPDIATVAANAKATAQRERDITYSKEKDQNQQRRPIISP